MAFPAFLECRLVVNVSKCGQDMLKSIKLDTQGRFYSFVEIAA